MKDQYVGDAGDYGKYGLLRYLAQNGIRIGVNWYLTENDKIAIDENVRGYDGSIRGYLEHDEEGVYDRDVFELLKSLPKKSVSFIETSNIIPDAVFYGEKLETANVPKAMRKAERDAWHEKAVAALEDAELIFCDPDNGSVDEKGAIGKYGEKYVSLQELKAYYDSKKDVVYYCHKARRTPEAWQKKMVELRSVCPDVRIIVLTYRRGTQRSYIFGIHPERYETFNRLIDGFLQTSWGSHAVGRTHIPFFRESLSGDCDR